MEHEEELSEPWSLPREVLTPGLKLRVRRENARLTQEDLGMKLGGLSNKDIEDIEKGRRPIDPDLANILGDLFNDSPDYYLTNG